MWLFFVDENKLMRTREECCQETILIDNIAKFLCISFSV